MSEKEIAMCVRCHLVLRDEDSHIESIDCIAAMRSAMLRQRKAAETLGMVLSSRFLAVLEELCLDAETPGVEFHTMEMLPGGELGKRAIQSAQVTGIFAAIKERFHALGDWSPLKQAWEDLYQEQALNKKMKQLLTEVERQSKGEGRWAEEFFENELCSILHPDRD